VKLDGTVVAWGDSFYGQCDVPLPNSDFVAVAGGRYHSLGLKSDGTITAWGYNNFGQCDVPSPNTDFVAVAGGRYHSLGLKYDGTITAWGYNNDGECEIPSPNADFLVVAGGRGHSLGVRSPQPISVGELPSGMAPGVVGIDILSMAPNPLRASAEICFELRGSERLNMEIFDVVGRCVTNVFLGTVRGGRHWIQWDGRDAAGLNVAPGVYFLRLRADTRESHPVRVLVLR